jgi:hypothetical protein
MIQIKIGKKYLSVATEWNDLTPHQLLELMDTIYIKKYENLELMLKVFKILLQYNYRSFFNLKISDIEDYLYLVGFLFGSRINLTKQLIPHYSNLYGPSDGIGNVLMGEFTFSEHYFMNWHNDKTCTKNLDQFVAVLYRPAKKKYDFEKNPDGDCRVSFNENVCAWYADNFIHQWPENIKLAIATWYEGCRQLLVDRNPDVFGGSGEPSKYGLIEIMMNLAKEGTHGDFEQVERKSVHLMMIQLNVNIEEAKRIETQLKQSNP